MKQLIVCVLIGLVGTTLACAEKGDGVKKGTPFTPKVTREYLVAHGFKKVADDPGIFAQEHVRLGNVLGDLGVPLASLRLTANASPDSDVRTAEVGGIYVVVEAEGKRNKGRAVRSLLDNPDTICTVRVVLNPPSARRYLRTDSTPRLRIRSVTVPEDGAKSLNVTFELAATGKKPLAIAKRDFDGSLTRNNLDRDLECGVRFSEESPQIISVSPSKPIVLRVTVYFNADLLSGEYVLRLRIGGGKGREPQSFDYEWEGQEYLSDNFKFVVK